ncbi:MAG: 16S rRNA (uracil(1498)-N(3))-methyltransferase [Thermotogaceae bacterium]|nr:16S rRNA (uracil(1498)-N(3))-methyltransferase [Thermotogaceae bacterium]
MPNIFFGKPKGDVMEFDEHESEHLRVVRTQIGEKVDVTDGKGIIYRVIIRKISKKKSYGDIIEAHKQEDLPSRLLTLYIGSSSWDRLRILIEKAVELGVDRIVVYKAEKSKRDYIKKRKKIELIIRDAAKQCKRTLFPFLNLVHSTNALTEYLNGGINILLDPKGQPIREIEFGPGLAVGIIVGPESGLTDEEKKVLLKKAMLVSLGKRVLRFETAALAALTIVSYGIGRI